LIHIDLPWNPMRLHQRVGRLNRYGQTRKVEVFTVRNPDTVEARIWVKLNAKIEQIILWFAGVRGWFGKSASDLFIQIEWQIPKLQEAFLDIGQG
jgi:hypothetical protein